MSTTPRLASLTKDKIKLRMKHFSRIEENELKKISFPYANREPLKRGIFPVPMLVRYLLVNILNFIDLGRQEKTMWIVPFYYEKLPFMISFEKFGLRFYYALYAKPEEVREAKKRIISEIDMAIKILEKELLMPFGKRQIEKGNVTLENNYHRLRNMYEFFREQSEYWYGEGQKREEEEVQTSNGHEYTSIRIFGPNEGFYNTSAMINAFYSWLEHVLILVLPFTSFDPGTDDLLDLVKSHWPVKFKRVFDINQDKEAKEIYDNLVNVKDQYRNPILHGLFEKGGGSLFFHLQGAGAIPLIPREFGDSLLLRIIPVEEKDFTEVCDVFDRFDEWMKRKEKVNYGMIYAESGLSVPFDKKSLEKFEKHMTSEDNFSQFVEDEGRFQTMYDNMDW